jgi:hypothetical protein
MNLDEMLTPFLTWQFILSAVLINAVIAYVRRFARQADPTILTRRWFKALMTVANPILGLAIAFVPSFLYGNRLVERLFVGVCAGFLSHFIYSMFIKRLTRQRPVDDVDEGIPEIPASEADTKLEKIDKEKSR